ncbi:hypothetical protein PPL_01525 [Heterostelium album PN500]|uniref:Protein kinase domain-containing protein n=1 Tax=Heterostelium pallidum (strain ATCC 26659 / Pp 5 / PN500) TaxID=670386 RepID=D3AZR2_HETP5|nr:hypothetical protein PPL_01525 [Heterostelium album PN500]EFA84536.1 hypothetical protein PPL_01525 [Heterostelium album PN500]|eukprot:XP_020436649.1 hypothetical protein PPL_01525 [Heterostelium album PN500]
MSLKSPITASSSTTQPEPDLHSNFNENLINLVVQNQALTAKSGSAVPNPLPKPPSLVQKIRDLKNGGNDELLPGINSSNSNNNDTEQNSVNNDYSSSANDGSGLLLKQTTSSENDEFEIDSTTIASNNNITNNNTNNNNNNNILNSSSSATTTPTNTTKPTLESSISLQSLSNLSNSTSTLPSPSQQSLFVNSSHFKSSPNLLVKQNGANPVVASPTNSNSNNSSLNEQKQALRNPKKYKSISTCEFKLESKLVYPPLPPVPHMSRSANNASYDKELLKLQLDNLNNNNTNGNGNGNGLVDENNTGNGSANVSPNKSKSTTTSSSSTESVSSPASPVSPTSSDGKKLRRSSVDSALRDFQQSFKSLVAEDETLITYYSCGYQGSVLKHGRLYLTEHFLCFYDNIVFDKTKQRQKIIPISTIISIEKKSGLAPNGILIKTNERDFVINLLLTLFIDEAFDVMEALMLYQEKQLLTESIIQRNVNGLKQALSQRKTRKSTSTKSSKRSRSADGNVFSTLRTPITFEDPPIVNVIKQNDTEMLNLLLEYYTQNKSDEINQPDKEGYSPLHVAASSEISDNMMIHILKHPTIDVNVKNMDGNTPLHYFCQKFRSPECQKIVQMFIEKGANVNEQNTMGETPLHKAIFNHSVRLLMVHVLLKNGANINLVNNAGESALHYAVRLGRLDVLKTLITSGADPALVSTKQRKTPLMLAEENNCPEISDLLKRLESNLLCYGCLVLINSLSSSGLGQYRMALILEEITQEGALARIDENMMARIGCYDEDQRKQLYGLKGKKFFGTVPAITPGAMDLLKELENMDIKNGKWIISQHELEYTDKIGSGVSGKVYKGLYRGREVAIKVLKSADEAHNREEFLKEFHVLASLQSNLIVGLYGVVLEPRICLVMDDVYSLGVVFWELIFALINGRYLHPYGEYKRMNAFQIMLCTSNHNLRPTIPLNCPESVKTLVTRCWDQDLLLRPTCTEAIEILAACEVEFTQNQSAWNEILTMKDETSKHLSMDSSLSLSDASD